MVQCVRQFLTTKRIAKVFSDFRVGKSMPEVRWAFDALSWHPTASEWQFAIACVQPEERIRIGRFHFSDDARLSLAGRLLIRRAVSRALSIPYKEIILTRTKENKPILKPNLPGFDCQGFNFNVSHAGDFAVIAASDRRLVGVDVMDIRFPLRGSVPDFFESLTPQYGISYIFICLSGLVPL